MKLVDEWVLDPQGSKFLALLQVFATQYLAIGIQCGGDDQSIVERQLMVASQHDSPGMNSGSQWARRAEQFFDNRNRGFNLFPLPTQLAPRDGREFVEDLNADDATVGDERLGSGAARIISGGVPAVGPFSSIGFIDAAVIG